MKPLYLWYRIKAKLPQFIWGKWSWKTKFMILGSKDPYKFGDKIYGITFSKLKILFPR